MRRVVGKYRSLSTRLGATARDLRADERGVSFIITAMALVVLFGFAGLAVDVVMWQVQQRTMQGAADQAALAGVEAYRVAGLTDPLGTDTTVQNAAYAAAIKNGYPVSSGCSSPPCVTAVAYNTPAVCNSPVANNCIKVTIAQLQPRYFTKIFLSNAVSASASAAATCIGCGTTTTASSGSPCVMALDPSGNGVVSLKGNPTLSLNACDLYNNSPSTTATIVQGSAVVQGCSLTNSCGSAAFLAQPDDPSGAFDIPVNLNAGSSPDPYAGSTVPTVAGSCIKSFPANPVPSGTYCPGNINNQSITFANNSVIVITGGLSTKGNSTLTCTSCMLYVKGGASINANSQVNISAPTTALYTGAPKNVAVWFADSTANGGDVSWNGNNSTGFSGAIYAPTANIDFSGTSNVFPTVNTACARVISASVSLGGTANVNLNNAGCGVVGGQSVTTQNSPTHPMLVE